MIRTLLPVALVLILFGGCSGDDEDDASPSASHTGTPTAEPSATDVPPAEITVGDAVDFPEDVVLIVETGCTQCDGPATGLSRLYYDDALGDYQSVYLYSAGLHTFRDGDGIRSEAIWRVGPGEDGEVEADSLRITGVAASLDGSRLAVSSCVEGRCADGGMVGANGDAVTVVHFSDDQGFTWRELARLDGSVRVRSVLAGQVVIVSYPPSGSSEGWTFQSLPGGAVLTQPPSASPFLDPLALPGSVIGWAGRGGSIQDTSGAVLFELPDGGPHNLTGFAPCRDSGAKDFAIATWQANEEGMPSYVTLFGDAGATVRSYRSPVFIQAGAWLTRSEAVVSIAATPDLIDSDAFATEGFTVIPAILDLENEVIHPITRPFLDDGGEWGRNRVAALQSGRLSCAATFY